MTTPNEPEVIAELRGWHREGCESLFTIGEVLAVDIPAILAAYDAIVAERDEWRDAAKWAEGQHQHWKTVAEAATAQRDEARRLHMVVRNELDTLRARLTACDRVVEAAKRVINADTDVLQAVAIVMLREALAAKTRVQITDAMRLALGVLTWQMEARSWCGDPDAECPLQDACKPSHDHTLAIAALTAALEGPRDQ